MNKKKIIVSLVIGLLLIILLPVGGLWLVMISEGYPTIAGVRNLFQRDGQIRIELPPNFQITNVEFEGEALESIKFGDNAAVIRVGYSIGYIRTDFINPHGKAEFLEFGEVRKFNNWNRITFCGKADAGGTITFEVDENGISRDSTRYRITQGAR